jgi:hypothetical protein
MGPANSASPRFAAGPSQPAPLSGVRQQEFRVPASCKVLLGATRPDRRHRGLAVLEPTASLSAIRRQARPLTRAAAPTRKTRNTARPGEQLGGRPRSPGSRVGGAPAWSMLPGALSGVRQRPVDVADVFLERQQGLAGRSEGVGYARLSSSTGMVRTPAVRRAYSAKPGWRRACSA